MMYSFPLVLPANTPQKAPISLLMQLTAGNIAGVQVQFPGGPIGLAHVYICHGLNQLWPSNTADDFASDGETIAWGEDIDVTADDNTLTAFGYNLDTLNPHTITIRINIIPPSAPSTLAAQVAQLLQTSAAATP